jgi:phage shock protein C
MTDEVKRLYRSREDRMVAGVCGGLAEYTNLDPTMVRLLFVAVAILGAAPGLVLAYLAMMVIVPEEAMIEVSSGSE